MTASTHVPPVRASELRGRGWLNTGGQSYSIEDFRGRVLLLDFWTFCCINCLHVIDELRDLEERFADVLVTIGVHSPKFAHEADPDALAAAIERYDVAHPVLDDPELHTWKAYTARAWPTLVLIDPEGYIVAHLAGEGHAPTLTAHIESLIDEHEAKGTLHRGQGPYVPPEPSTELLKFPAKAIRLPTANLLIADAGHHRLVEMEPDGQTPVRFIGSGTRGRTDGDAETAQFSEPNGLCLLPEHIAATAGYDVVVADTVNHLLRGVHLASGTVTTLAGTGQQFMLGAPDNVAPDPADPADPAAPADPAPATEDYGPAHRIKLSSPWDVAWVPYPTGPDAAAGTGTVVIAMAGHHTLWTFDPVDAYLTRLAGTKNEGLVNGPLRQSWFAQPSGLATGPDGHLWVADSETSALRRVDLTAQLVHTAVGHGLFEFGHRDGDTDQALLQHPLGVATLPDGRVAIADTYNGAVRIYDPATEQVSTAAAGLAEPSGLIADDDGTHLIVVESAAHRLTRVALPAQATTHDGGAHQVRREVTEVGPEVVLRVVFTPPPGRKLDDRFGPSTELDVAAAADALSVGAGSGTDLQRDLTFTPGAGQTVLSVTAKAASCDDDPAVPSPACHLAAQDWGIPVRVVDGGPSELVLNFAG